MNLPKLYQAVMTPARLCICADSSEPSLPAYAIISWHNYCSLQIKCIALGKQQRDAHTDRLFDTLKIILCLVNIICMKRCGSLLSSFIRSQLI